MICTITIIEHGIKDYDRRVRIAGLTSATGVRRRRSFGVEKRNCD
jgi:hypothetical protein